MAIRKPGTTPTEAEPQEIGNQNYNGNGYDEEDGQPQLLEKQQSRKSAFEAFGMEDHDERKKYRKRPIWTCCLFVAWAATICIVLLTHLAVSKVVPPISNLPQNVLKGFKETFRFQDLTKDGKVIIKASKEAMRLCLDVPAYDYKECSNIPGGLDVTKDVQTATQIGLIKNAFGRSLDMILNVTKDKCLKADGFNSTAKQLTDIKKEMDKVKGGKMPCPAVWATYCAMYQSGDALVAGGSEVDGQITNMTQNENIEKFTDYASNLKLLHGLPYILVMSMVFFTLFWWCSGGVCCCCRGGKCLGCLCCLVPHAILWLVYAILAAVIIGIGIAIPHFAKTTELPFAAGGKACTIEELMDHIELTYAPFYNLVFRDLIEGLLLFAKSFQAGMAMCLFIAGYALCICICRPYRRPVKGPLETE